MTVQLPRTVHVRKEPTHNGADPAHKWFYSTAIGDEFIGSRRIVDFKKDAKAALRRLGYTGAIKYVIDQVDNA